jgi:hypothetical protein
MSPTSVAAPPTPAGPGPKPSGPTHPVPTGPGPGRALLDHLDASLISALAVTLPEPADRLEACGQAILAFRLRRARAALADLIAYSETPARQHLSSAAAVADGPVTNSGRGGKDTSAEVAFRPIRPRAGEPPLPGADFRLPRDVRGPLLDALNRRAD